MFSDLQNSNEQDVFKWDGVVLVAYPHRLVDVSHFESANRTTEGSWTRR